MENFVSTLNKNTIETEISNIESSFFTTDQSGIIKTGGQIISDFEEVITKLQQYQSTTNTQIVEQLLVIYNYITDLVSFHSFVMEDPLENITTYTTTFNYFIFVIKYLYNKDLDGIAYPLSLKYNPTKKMYYIWKNIFELLGLFSENVNETNTDIQTFGSVILIIQKIVGTYKEVCSSMRDLWNNVKDFVDTQIQPPSFYILNDVVFPFGILIGTHEGTTSLFENENSKGLYSGFIYKTMDPESPHLSSQILKTKTEQITFEEISVGNYQLFLTSVENIEIGNYAIIGNIYYDSTITKRYCEYGRVVQINTQTNEIVLQGSLHITHYGHPSVIIFSMPQEILGPPLSNSLSISYTVINSTNWKEGQLLCEKVQPTTTTTNQDTIQICSIYTWMPNHYTVYKQTTIENFEEQYTLFLLHVDNIEYNYPTNSFVVFYETELTQMLTLSQTYYNQLLFTSRLSTTPTIGETTLSTINTKDNIETIVENGCLISLSNSNGIHYYEIESISQTTVNLKLTTPIEQLYESGSMIHIFYLFSSDESLPPFNNTEYRQKTRPNGSLLSSITTTKTETLTGSVLIQLKNTDDIEVGCHLSIDYGNLNEYYLYVISVNHSTKTVTLSTPVNKHHPAGCIVQIYLMENASVQNTDSYVGIKTIEWKTPSQTPNADYLFSVVSLAGSVCIALNNVNGLSKGMIGVLGAGSSSTTPTQSTTEYIHLIDIDPCCCYVYINKPLQFNYPEYHGIQFFSLPKLIQQQGVSLQNIFHNIQPTSVGDEVIYLNSSAGLEPGQIISVDSYGNTELTTIDSVNPQSIPNTILVIPPLGLTHPINSTFVNYKFVIHSVPKGTVKTEQKKTTDIVIPNTNQIFLTSVDGLDLNTYLLIGYSDFLDIQLKIMEIKSDPIFPSIFVDNCFTNHYYKNTLCQFYKYPNLITNSQSVILSHTYNTEYIISGATSFKIENIHGIRIGTLLQIGKTECKVVEDYYENMIIVNTPFSRTYEKNTLIQLYVDNVPGLPKDSQLLTTTFTRNVAMSGDCSLTLDKYGLCVENETFILLGSPPFVETCLITSINNNTTPAEITINSPLQYTHSHSVIAQLFKYKDIPKGAILQKRTTLTQDVDKGSFILYFETTSINQTSRIYLQIGSGENLEIDLPIIGIHQNFVELSRPLNHDHLLDSSVSIYSYSPLPSNTALITVLQLNKPIYIGCREIYVDKVKDFRIGMNYFLQVGTGNNIDQEISVLSVNLTNKTVVVSSPFSFNHPKGSTVQVYMKGLPEPSIPSANQNTYVLEEPVECGSVALSISCINGITVGMYGLIDIGDVVEHFIVMGVNKNKISINLQMVYSHKTGSVIQFFNAVHPSDTLLIKYSDVYERVKSTENLNMSDPLETNEELEFLLKDTLILYRDKWESMYPLSRNAVLLITPLISITESRCLTFMLNQTTSTISAFVPYYKTIQYYYKELTTISKYNPTIKVRALWSLIREIITDILPIVDNSNGTDIKNLIPKIQMVYSIYYQLYMAQLRLESYLRSVNIKVLPRTPHLNNTDFLVLQSVDLSFGTLIGGSVGGIGVINEPGTIYSKPHVKNQRLIVSKGCRQQEKTRQGDNEVVLSDASEIYMDSVIIIDIGVAQETRGVFQINGNTIVLDEGLTYPHNENTMIFICRKTTPINFVLNEFTTDFRLIQNMEIMAERYDVPTSTFMAYGNIDIELFRNTFLFGTTHLNEFIEEFSNNSPCKTYKNIKKKIMGFYVDASSWNDEDSYQPKLDFSKLKCNNGYYNIHDYLTESEPDLSKIQTATLIYNIFDIVDGVSLVKNMNVVATSIKHTFSKYIWNSVYGTILWTQDYNRKPLETIIVDTQEKQTVNFSNENLVEDPLNPGMYFIPSDENNGSITQKLFSQLTGGDITRLRTAKRYKGTSNIYHFPFVEGDTIVFKVSVKYAMDNVEYICSSPDSPISSEMIALNKRFNEGLIEHVDFNSYTVVLTLV